MRETIIPARSASDANISGLTRNRTEPGVSLKLNDGLIIAVADSVSAPITTTTNRVTATIANVFVMKVVVARFMTYVETFGPEGRGSTTNQSVLGYGAATS
jgi:hypothetical protein